MSLAAGAGAPAAGFDGAAGRGVCASTGSVVAHMKTNPRAATISRTLIMLLSFRLEGLRQGQADLVGNIAVGRQIRMSLIVSGVQGQVHSLRNIKTKRSIKR